MDKSTLMLSAYLPIVIGLGLIIFNKLITENYGKFSSRDGSVIPRLIRKNIILIGGAALLILGLIRFFTMD